jgi:hypothetical protein
MNTGATGLARSLRNPIWKNVRRYGGKGRETPLEVPIEIEGGSMMTAERWAAMQQIILERRETRAKTRKPPVALVAGLVCCGRCGAPCYMRYSGDVKAGRVRIYYICSSMYPKRTATACGATAIRHEGVDEAVGRIVAEQLLDAAFLRAVLAQHSQRQPARDHDAAKLAKQRKQLEDERRTLLRMTLQKKCSEEDYTRESKRIEGEIRDLDALAPAPLDPAFDVANTVLHITRAFARFERQGFEAKRTLLRSAVKKVVLEDGTIPALTLNGTFLDRVNVQPRSTASSGINTMPDLTITLPAPIVIPTIDRRCKTA